MALKILLLAAAAVAAWMISRPRAGKKRRAAAETEMARCARCGVYHPAGEPCGCDK